MQYSGFRIWILVFCSAVAGCSGSKDAKLVPFTGQVKYKGRPVAEATVTIQPESGAIASAITDADGKFVAMTGRSKGVAIGKCKIMIEAWVGGSGPQSSAPTMTGDEARDNPNAMSDMMKKAMMNRNKSKPKSLIPTRYSKAETTPLRDVEIPASGKTDYEIELKD